MRKVVPGGLRIGWAMGDITPDRPVNLYGQFHARIATEALDPLTVTALAIQSEAPPGEAVVWVACDRCTVPAAIQQRCREAVAERCPDLAPETVILHATHTHTAPVISEGCFPEQAPEVMTPGEYADLFVERVAATVEEAWSNRAPGAVSWAFGWAVVGHNRRAAYFDDLSQRPGYQHRRGGAIDGSSKMYGRTDDPSFSHIEGWEDHAVDLLYCFDATDRLTGVVVNLACPSQEVEGLSAVSADFWHDIREAIRAQLGDVFVLGQCSAAGDQSPHLLVHRRAEDRMLALRGLSRRQEIGRRVATAVVEAFGAATQDIRRELVFRHECLSVGLPRRRVSEAELALAKDDLARLEAERPENAAQESARYVAMNRCRRVIDRYETQATEPELSEEIHVVRLGEVAFATNRFELFLDYGVRIKARSPAIQTFVVQLAGGGRYTGTYLPTARAEAGGSYSAGVYCNEVGSDGGQVLVEETLRALERLFKEEEEES